MYKYIVATDLSSFRQTKYFPRNDTYHVYHSSDGHTQNHAGCTQKISNYILIFE